MANTPLKRIRVDEDLWDDFGQATNAVGSDRTKTLVGFMRRYVAAMAIDRTDPGDRGDDPSRSTP
ncbi:MAG: hypothetical protein V4515_15030 [Chloroflexota bacterium]